MMSSVFLPAPAQLDVRAALAGNAIGLEEVLEQRREVDAADVLIERHARHFAGGIDADVAACSCRHTSTLRTDGSGPCRRVRSRPAAAW